MVIGFIFPYYLFDSVLFSVTKAHDFLLLIIFSISSYLNLKLEPSQMTVDDVYISFLPLAHILDRMIEEYFFHKGASVGYFHGVSC